MKITYICIYKVIIYIIFFVNLGLLNLKSNTIPYFLNLTGVIALLLFILYLSQKNKAKYNFKIEKFWVICVLGYIVFQLFRILNGTVISISLNQAFKSTLPYLLILLIFPIKEIIHYDGYDKLFKGIFYLGIFASLLRFLVYTLYNFFGITIMQGIINERGFDWIRGGHLRLSSTFLDGFIFTYSIYMIFKKNEKKYILCVLYELFYAILVYQSRSQVICFVLTFIIMSLFKDSNIIKSLVNIFFIGIIILCVVRSSYFNNFMQSFSITNIQNGAGTQIRIDGLNYYCQQWLNFDIPFGLGLVNDGTNILSVNLGMHNAYLSDLGILGTLFRLGIIGFVIFIFPMIYGLLQSLFNIYKNPIALFSLGLTSYIILSSIMSQNVYNDIRISLLPIWIIVIFLSEYRNLNNI